MPIIVGELTQERALDAIGGECPHVIYSDPPWGPALLSLFRRMNGEADYLPDWPRFLAVLADVAARSKATHTFLEIGSRFVDDLAASMAASGFAETKRWDVLYGSPKRPSVLWYSGPGADCDPTGMSGVAMTKHVIDSVARPGALVFDPCCGNGMTARCAVRAGMRFAGVELNPKRAQVTINWLVKHDPSWTG